VYTQQISWANSLMVMAFNQFSQGISAGPCILRKMLHM